MIKYTEVEDCNAAVSLVQKQLHFTALVLTHPLDIAIWHFLRHGPALLVVGIRLHDVRRALSRVVQRAHQFVLGRS